MTLWQRFLALLGVKAEHAIDRFEDPSQSLEAAYRKQLTALDEARRGVADVLTAEKRLEIEAGALLGTIERYRAAALQSATAGDDDVARRALVREEFTIAQRDRVLGQAAEIKTQRLSLEATVERLRMKLELFRTEKLALKARLATAKASTLAGETLGGFSADAADVARTVERAREHTLAAQARAEAVTQLADAEDALAPDNVARIEARLAQLKLPRDAGAAGG